MLLYADGFDCQAAENPDSYLNQGPTPTFTSRYADPNHPASSGDPLALVTGGHASMGALRGGHGIRGRRNFGAVGLIGSIMEMRNPSNDTGSTSRPVYGTGPGRNAGPPRPLGNIGALAPITKLLQKVKTPKVFLNEVRLIQTRKFFTWPLSVCRQRMK